MPIFVNQTICHQDGRFRAIAWNASNQHLVDIAWNASNQHLVDDWERTLIYMSIHDFRHEPARNEYRARKQECGSGDKQPPPRYEFECRDNGFMISSLPTAGMGATMRTHAVYHVLIGIAANRIPLFVSNAKVGFHEISKVWRLASCPQEEFQCVFFSVAVHLLSKAKANEAAAAKASNYLAERPSFALSYQCPPAQPQEIGRERCSDTEYNLRSGNGTD